jgi:hypothetical protein
MTDKTRYPAFSRTNPGNIISAQVVSCGGVDAKILKIMEKKAKKYMALSWHLGLKPFHCIETMLFN